MVWRPTPKQEHTTSPASALERDGCPASSPRRSSLSRIGSLKRLISQVRDGRSGLGERNTQASNRTRAGVCLNSGSPDTGSTAELTRVPTRASAAYWEFQCIAAKTIPRPISPLQRKRAVIDPHRVDTCTSSPGRTPASSASCACRSTKGSVLHQSRRTSGYSKLQRRSFAWKRCSDPCGPHPVAP